MPLLFCLNHFSVIYSRVVITPITTLYMIFRQETFIYQVLSIKSMRKKERVLEYWHIAIIILAILMFLLLKSSITGRASYRDYGGYGGSWFGSFSDVFDFLNFSDLYSQYGYIIDAIIFMLIFMAIAQNAFKEKFKESKPLVIGLGLFLTLALLMYEEQNQVSLLLGFGPLGLIVILILLVYGFGELFQRVGLGKFSAWSLGYIFVYYFFVKNTPFITPLITLLSSSWPQIESILSALVMVALIILLAEIVRVIGGKFPRRKSRGQW